MSGHGVTLTPLGLDHLDPLWAQARAHPDSFAYLRYGPFKSRDALRLVLEDLSAREDQPFWAVVPDGDGPMGWASICDIYPADGSIEVGSIWFSPALQGTRAARAALFLLMSHCMDHLAYERLVWRCQVQNAKSMRAAENLGFRPEGVWRRAAVVKGWQRDVAWFSILRDEWPACRDALERWLSPENFNANGRQIQPLRHD